MADEIIPTVPGHPVYPSPPTPPGPETVTTHSLMPGALPPPPPNHETDAAGPATSAPKSGFWHSLWKSSPQPNHPPVDSTREVVETVVFVIVLVLLLKSFVAEVFVIPTGSMAETLWGYQKVITCPECNYQFPVNCSAEVETQNGRLGPRVDECICPNCRKLIHLQNPYPPPDRPERPLRTNETEIPDPGATSGDRVLVAKFLYDLFNRDPDRLDVVVFKFPGNGNPNDVESFPNSGPFKNHVPMNYIKRLIGLPGETIAIQGGKLYVLPRGKQPKEYQLPPLPQPRTPQEAWMVRYMYNNAQAARDLFSKGDFQILRKGPDNILAMKRLVYDNDHLAKDLKGKVPPRWAGDGWNEEDATGFKHAAEGDKLSWLRYRHLLRDSQDKPKLITDFMGYNSAGGAEGPGHWARDLVLECEVAIDKAEGELVLELGRGVDRFEAQWNLADGVCKMVRIGEDGKPRELGSARTGVQKGTYHLRLSDVDERLFLWVNDKLIFPDGVIFEPPANPCPTNNDLEPAGIAVKGAAVQVKHLKLWRDTYYTTGERSGSFNVNPDLIVDQAKWSDYKDMPFRTMYVQPDHFLCMGDNSPHSADSRAWGLVPRRLLLGKALAVYYPFYFPFWPLSSQVNRIGLIH